MIGASPTGPQVPTVPNQDVFESVMRVSQMIVQQMWERDSVLLQLPHIQSDMLKKHFKYLSPHSSHLLNPHIFPQNTTKEHNEC